METDGETDQWACVECREKWEREAVAVKRKQARKRKATRASTSNESIGIIAGCVTYCIQNIVIIYAMPVPWRIAVGITLGICTIPIAIGFRLFLAREDDD